MLWLTEYKPNEKNTSEYPGAVTESRDQRRNWADGASTSLAKNILEREPFSSG